MLTRRGFLGSGAVPLAPSAVRPPNVILIVTDDQGWFDLGVHGNPHIETPTLDRIASEGVRFERFYCSPVCTPTRASLLTGRHYQRTGAVDTYKGRDTLAADEVTLGEVFLRQGYRTACIGKWHLGRYMRYHPNERGFQEFFGFWQYGFINRYDDPEELWHNKRPVTATGYITDVLTEQATAFIEQNRSRPFFLYLAYNAPHAPYLVPDRYIALYLRKGLPLDQARIYGMIHCVDENLGRLLSVVDRLKLANETVILFLSDNGGVSRYYSCGLRGNKGSVYEGGIRVPLLVRWPGRFPAGAVVRTPAQHIDLFPTLCELIGAPLPPDRKIDGRSLVAWMRRPETTAPPRRLYHQWNRVRPLLDPPADPSEAPPEERKAFRPNWAVHDPRGFKLHANGELYDLPHDPGERQDVAAAHPELVRELRADFARFFHEVTAERSYRRVPIEVGREDENPVEIDLTWGEPVGKKVRPTYRHYNRDTIEDWSESGDAVRWNLEVVRPGRYEVTFEYGCQPEDAGSRFQVTAGQARLEGRVEPTPARLVFQPFVVGTMALERGPCVFEIRPLAIRGRELMALHRIWLRRLS